MIEVNVNEAKTKLSELPTRVACGEEVTEKCHGHLARDFMGGTPMHDK